MKGDENEIIIIYKISRKGKIKLFGKEFVSSLISIPDISKWKTNKVKNMSYLFNKCYSLAYIPNINNWNISNVSSREGMFKSCLSLVNIFY